MFEYKASNINLRLLFWFVNLSVGGVEGDGVADSIVLSDFYIKKKVNENQWFKAMKVGSTSINRADGLVGYDTALTRRGSRVQFPDCVVVFLNFF